VTEDEIHKMAALELSHWWYVGTREICFSILRPHLPLRAVRRILDVGCGTGGNLLELTKYGRAEGIDLDRLCVDYCRRKGLDVRLGSMQELGAAPESVDVITMFDALTQADPADTDAILDGMARALTPGGLIAFREPAMRMAGGAHDRAVNIRQRFTAGQIRLALDRAGFEPLRTTYLNTLLFPPIVLARRLGDLLRPGHAASDVQPAPALLNAALLAVLRAEARLLQAVDLPFGVSLFAVAKKR
jgi:SAM-dependent methyltransferase